MYGNNCASTGMPLVCALEPEDDELRDLHYVIGLVYERCRIRLHEGKHQLIRARLGKLLRQGGFRNLHEYCDFLRRNADEEAFSHLVDAITTNYTHFLREKDHFDFLVRQALPQVLTGGKRRLRVWSAACATGEEPYSIAFYLEEHYPAAQGWDWRILATDVSGKALATAQNAVYPAERLGSIPDEWVRKYFQRGHGRWDGYYRVKPWLSERVSFKRVNLLGDYGCIEPFETIFCRNVMIYFDRPTQETLVNRLSEYLISKGHLVVGHSESLIGLPIRLKCRRPSIYQKE